jgi:hypothetical protein
MNPEDGRVVSNFICQALRGEDITIYGEGQQTRSFQYIDDLIEGMVRMMENTQGFTGPVNLGNPGEFTIRQLADMVLQKIETSSKLVQRPLPSDDPTQRRPEISLAGEMLGWKPTIPLSDGLDRTIAYFRKRIGNRTCRGAFGDGRIGLQSQQGCKQNDCYLQFHDRFFLSKYPAPRGLRQLFSLADALRYGFG